MGTLSRNVLIKIQTCTSTFKEGQHLLQLFSQGFSFKISVSVGVFVCIYACVCVQDLLLCLFFETVMKYFTTVFIIISRQDFQIFYKHLFFMYSQIKCWFTMNFLFVNSIYFFRKNYKYR